MKDKLLKRKHKKRILFLLLALVCAAAAGICALRFYGASEQETDTYTAETVQRGDLVSGITESGTVALAESEILYDLEAASDEEEDDDDDEDDEESSYLKIEAVYVAQGQRIQEGDALFLLTEASVRSVRRILESNEAEAAVTLAQAQSSYTLETQEAANTRDGSKVEASVAGDVYNATIETLQNTLSSYAAANEQLAAEIEECQEKIWDEDMREALSDARNEMNSALSVLEETDVENVVAYTANQGAYEMAKSAVDSYEDQIDAWNETIMNDMEKVNKNNEAIEEVTKALEYRYQLAESEKSLSELNGSLADEVYAETVSSLSETVTEAQNAYDEAAQALEEFNAFVGDDGVVYADGSGLVTAVNYDEGDQLTSAGAMITYVETDGYTISVDVSEEDIPDVSVGDSVSIVFSAYPDETYEGTVATISTSRSDTYSSTVSYPVEITIEGDTSKLYGGMTADVTFATDSVQDVLYVSSRAIVEEDGVSYVYVKKEGAQEEEEYELQEVETGFTDGSSVAITAGLSEGDTVYVRSSR
ncbi:MAG: HlyD family efflux transporter periplasmic adaptor subunit [Eubacteriales bacterium]|nr:HlyD family efflux transporter periplasmic adaptor subunit [Eubacteriales bacterium]